MTQGLPKSMGLTPLLKLVSGENLSRLECWVLVLLFMSVLSSSLSSPVSLFMFGIFPYLEDPLAMT
jgi:hypothetical protein